MFPKWVQTSHFAYSIVSLFKASTLFKVHVSGMCKTFLSSKNSQWNPWVYIVIYVGEEA